MRTKLSLGISILTFLLTPLAGAEQTQTTDYREWSQWLYDDDTLFTTNTTFTISNPHGWTVTGGEAVLRIRGWLQKPGVVPPSTSTITPEVLFDGHFLSGNQSISGHDTGVGDNCGILGPFAVMTGTTHIWTIDKECPFDRKLPTFGTHGIRMRNLNTGGADAQYYTFTIIYRVSVTYTQPGSVNQFNRHEATSNSTLGLVQNFTASNLTASQVETIFQNQTVPIADSITNYVPLLVFVLVIIWAEISKQWLIYILAILTGAAIVIWWPFLPALRVIIAGATLILAGLAWFSDSSPTSKKED